MFGEPKAGFSTGRHATTRSVRRLPEWQRFGAAGVAVLVAFCSYGQEVGRSEGESPPRPRWTIGNASVPLLMEAWGSPIPSVMQRSRRIDALLKEKPVPPETVQLIQALRKKADDLTRAQRFTELDGVLGQMLQKLGDTNFHPQSAFADSREEVEGMLDRCDRLKAKVGDLDGIEDYIGWAVVEPQPGKWDWTPYLENAKIIRSRGYQYIPYIWIQNLPHWVRAGRDYDFASVTENKGESDFLAIHSAKTRRTYDRFFGELKKVLGPQIDLLRVGSPYDYGETAYPANASEWAFPHKNAIPGFWVNDPAARAHFIATMMKRYGSLDALNSAWHTAYAGQANIDYPTNVAVPRRWLDFINWYHDSFTEMMRGLLQTARKHFPDIPVCVNLGWPFEKVNLGQDLVGLVKACSEEGIVVRTPTGPMVPFLYTKRVATAAHYYHLREFSSEPVDGSAPPSEIALALFKDLTTGVSWHFDYPDNLDRAPELYRQCRAVPRRSYPELDVALFFPTAAQRLENWDTWRKGLMAGGYPDGMVPFAEQMRDVVDYDVLDECLIRDGALTHYRTLIWAHTRQVESDTLQRILAWVKSGGVLVVQDWSKIEVLVGPEVQAAPRQTFTRGYAALGRGGIFDARGNDSRIIQLMGARGEASNDTPRLTELPPLDTTPDGVLASCFQDGILLFNRTEKPVRKTLPDLSKEKWKLRYAKLPAVVDLPPYTLRWIAAATGR